MSLFLLTSTNHRRLDRAVEGSTLLHRKTHFWGRGRDGYYEYYALVQADTAPADSGVDAVDVVFGHGPYSSVKVEKVTPEQAQEFVSRRYWKNWDYLPLEEVLA